MKDEISFILLFIKNKVLVELTYCHPELLQILGYKHLKKYLLCVCFRSLLTKKKNIKRKTYVKTMTEILTLN